MFKCDCVIVGAGLFGAVFARQLTDAGFRCEVLDKRPCVGGNCHTSSTAGVIVHDHGPHIFHTGDAEIWNYVQRFAQFLPYQHRVQAVSSNRLYSFPINIQTLCQLWNTSSAEVARDRLQKERAPYLERGEQGDLKAWALAQVGPDLYERFIKGYTLKQWGRDPALLPASILKRLKVRDSCDDRYFSDLYQGIPKGGYTPLIANLLKGISLKLDTDFLAHRSHWRCVAPSLVFTGPIDAYFDFRFGPLEYRSLRFESEVRQATSWQPCGVVNYCDDMVPFTRITEHRHFDSTCTSSQTVITREFPQTWKPGREPYYPINDACNQRRLAKYRAQARTEKGVLFGGRLAEYRYLDMHHVIASALAKANQWIKRQRV